MILETLWGGNSLPVGSKAPDFKAPDQNGKTHALSDYLGKWVVLYFYPKDHTFGCTKEACSFRDEHSSLLALNAVVIGVSTDSSESHKGFADKHSLPFALLADTDLKISSAFGVKTIMGMANRVTFIINPQGQIAEKISWANWFNYAKIVTEKLSILVSTAKNKV